MSADIIKLFSGGPVHSGDPDISGGETEREFARRMLKAAIEALAEGAVDRAWSHARNASKALESLAMSGMSEAEERAELVRRARRIARGEKAAETRARNARLQQAALARLGLKLTPDGVETTE